MLKNFLAIPKIKFATAGNELWMIEKIEKKPLIVELVAAIIGLGAACTTTGAVIGSGIGTDEFGCAGSGAGTGTDIGIKFGGAGVAGGKDICGPTLNIDKSLQ